MEITYSKPIVYSILRSIGCFLLWGFAFNLIVIIIIKFYSSSNPGYTFEYLFNHPWLAPWQWFQVWLVAGIVFGLIHRKKKNPIGLKRWGRMFLYMVLFGLFISSLQLWYIHRKHTGWYDMAEPNTCLNKYHSFWLINDKTYFQGIDNCLKAQKAREVDSEGTPKYIQINYPVNSPANIKTEFIDYDVITPQDIMGYDHIYNLIHS